MKQAWYCILLSGCTLVCQSSHYKEKLVPVVVGTATVATCAGAGMCGYAVTRSLADYVVSKNMSKKCATAVAALTTAGISWSVGPYLWDMWYMLCSKERQSPLIAKELLHDIDLYMQYLRVIKVVHAKLDQLSTVLEDQPEKSMCTLPMYRVACYSQGVTKKAYDAVRKLYDMGVSYDMPDIVQACSRVLGERHVEVRSSIDCENVCPHVKRSYVTIMSILRAFDKEELDQASAENLQKAIDGLLTYWDMFVEALHRQIQAKILYCQRLCTIETVISLHLGYQLGQTVPVQSE